MKKFTAVFMMIVMILLNSSTCFADSTDYSDNSDYTDYSDVTTSKDNQYISTSSFSSFAEAKEHILDNI
ncbi:hypothetical protein, partial [Herbinix luporum]|uniref:hypothetical protein n=1 Tax=Herbinix luporum TaxID=1679721 RepID=UPI0017551950